MLSKTLIGSNLKVFTASQLGSLLLLRKTCGLSKIYFYQSNQCYSYNYDNNINLGSVKVNELALLYREKTDRGS